jgi:hypothetical protein
MAEVKIELNANDRSSGIITKAMDKVRSVADTLKEHWVAASAAILGAWGTITKAISTAKIGADALQTAESFRAVASSYGISADSMLAKMKEVSAGIIGETSLQQRAVKGLQQGLSENQIVQLLEVARASARVAGVSVKEAFDMITNATANQTTRALKSLGIVIDQEKAFTAFAKKVGVSKDALDEMQQSQALADAAISEGKRQMQNMGDITLTAAEKIQKGQATIEGLKKKIGQELVMAYFAVKEAAEPAIDALKRVAEIPVAAYEYIKENIDAISIALGAAALVTAPALFSSLATAIKGASTALGSFKIVQTISNLMDLAAVSRVATQTLVAMGAAQTTSSLAALFPTFARLGESIKAIPAAISGVSVAGAAGGIKGMFSGIGAKIGVAATAIKGLGAVSVGALGAAGMAGVLGVAALGCYGLVKGIWWVRDEFSGLNKVMKETKEQQDYVNSWQPNYDKRMQDLGVSGRSSKEIRENFQRMKDAGQIYFDNEKQQWMNTARVMKQKTEASIKEIEAMNELSFKTQMMNPLLSEQQKEVMQLDEEYRKLGTTIKNQKYLDDQKQQALNFISEKQALELEKSLDELRVSLLYGIDKDLAEAGVKYANAIEDNRSKFSDNEDRKKMIVEKYAKDCLDIRAKYMKEELEKQKDNLTKWKDYWTQVYDYAAEKASAASEAAKKASEVAQSGRDYLAKLQEASLSPAQARSGAYKKLQDTMSSAGLSGDIDAIEKAMRTAEQFMDKYKGNVNAFGTFEDFDVRQVQEKYKSLINDADRIRKTKDDETAAWEKWKSLALSACEEIQTELTNIETKLKGIDDILKEAHELKLSTSAASEKLRELDTQLSDMLAKKMSLDGSAGSGLSSYTNYDANGNVIGGNTSSGGSGFARGAQSVAPAAAAAQGYGVSEAQLKEIVAAAVAAGGSGRPNQFTFGNIVVQGQGKDNQQQAQELVGLIMDEIARRKLLTGGQ